MIEDGHYSVLYPNGEYATYWIDTKIKGTMEGKTIIARGRGKEYEGLAFLFDGDRVAFWKKVRLWEDFPTIESEVQTILENPAKAAQVYAVREGRCSRCGRTLTVPASLYHGMGPECAGKGSWKKSDQIEAYEGLQQEI
jgi:hypothetical protein